MVKSEPALVPLSAVLFLPSSQRNWLAVLKSTTLAWAELAESITRIGDDLRMIWSLVKMLDEASCGKAELLMPSSRSASRPLPAPSLPECHIALVPTVYCNVHQQYLVATGRMWTQFLLFAPYTLIIVAGTMWFATGLRGETLGYIQLLAWVITAILITIVVRVEAPRQAAANLNNQEPTPS